MGKEKTRKDDQGLKDSQAESKRCRRKTTPGEKPGATAAAPKEEETKDGKGLGEGHEANPAEEGTPAEAQEEDPTKAPSDSGLSLTSTRLKIHQETQNAIAALKEGQLSERSFGTKSAIVISSLSGRSLKMKEIKTKKPKRAGKHSKAKVRCPRKSSCCCIS